MKVRHAWTVIIVGCLIGLGASAAWAETAAPAQDPVDTMMGRYHLHAPMQKLGRGVSNFLAGWMEIPLNVASHKSADDSGGSWFTGLGYGIIKGAVRTAVGAYETVTFFLPYPEDFAPILPTLAYFQKHSSPLPYE